MTIEQMRYYYNTVEKIDKRLKQIDDDFADLEEIPELDQDQHDILACEMIEENVLKQIRRELLAKKGTKDSSIIQNKGNGNSVVVNFSNGYKVEVSDCDGMSKKEIFAEAKKAMDFVINSNEKSDKKDK